MYNRPYPLEKSSTLFSFPFAKKIKKNKKTESWTVKPWNFGLNRGTFCNGVSHFFTTDLYQ